MPELKTFYSQLPEKHRTSGVEFLTAINSPPSSKSNYDITPYLKTVSQENKRRIEQLYKDDFTMFGYALLDEFDPDLSRKL